MPNIADTYSPLNITCQQGADFGPVTLTFTNPDGSPMDLTGCQFAAAVRKSFTTPVVAVFTVALVNATGGVVTLTLPASQVANLGAGVNAADLAGQYLWDFKLTSSTGVVSRPIGGTLLLRATVTP